MARKTSPKSKPVAIVPTPVVKPPPPPPPPPFERLLKSYDDERYLRRIRGDRFNKADKEVVELVGSRREVWVLLTDDEKRRAVAQSWRSAPEAYDVMDVEFEVTGVPIDHRPPKYWYDIPSFPRAHYTIDIDWEGVERQLKHYAESYTLNLNPDFQREHVWTPKQQTAYIEYQLQGGEVGKTLIFNHPNWSRHADDGELTIVDGKQRLEAVRAFMRNEVRAFGRFRNQWAGGRMDMFRAGFKFSIVEMRTRADLLRLYLNINAGGTPHTADELNKVRAMLLEAQKAQVSNGSEG